MSQDWFRDVFEFHEKFGCVIGSEPGEPDRDVRHLREDLVMEEVSELTRAMDNHDLPGVADAIVDACYVLLGTAVSYGLDVRPIWDEVHRSNMAKVGGGKRGDGKVMKPEGWQAPDVSRILSQQGPLTP